MPLPDFLKRKKPNLSKESCRNQLNDLESGKISTGLPLENVSEELFSDSPSNIFSCKKKRHHHKKNFLALLFKPFHFQLLSL
jgi:hypothetical protein